MARRSRSSRGQRATSIVDTVLGEAVSGTLQERFDDMKHIVSTMLNRANQYGVSIEDVLTHQQYNAYGTALPPGVERYRNLAIQALREVMQNGVVTPATYYATPKAIKGLPKGLKEAAQTKGHKYYVDPKNRPINTRVGTKRAVTAAVTPKTAPLPSSRPLDSLGGLGAAYRTGTAALGRVAPSSPAVLAGENFANRFSPASAPVPSRFGAVTAQDDAPMQAQPRSPPMGAVSGPLGPTPVARPLDQSQRFRPSPAPQMAIDPARMYAYAGLTRSLAPAAPVGKVATPATVATAPAPAPAKTIAAPAPSVPSFAGNQVIDTANQRVAAANTMNNMMTGQNMPVGPAQAPPAALAAARNLGTATAAKQIAPPAAMDAAKKLGTAIAAQQINAPAAIPADPRATAYASMPPGTPAALAQKVSQPAPRQVAAAPQVARTTQQRPTGGLPAGVAGPWGANIANQPPALDRMSTQSIARPTGKIADPAHPPGFMGKLGDFAQRYGPQIAGTMIAGPIGGLLGGLLGRSFDAAKPGQVFGNPFQGLANTAKAMGMFQSGTPYSGPISNYGTGLRAIGDVLGGAAPVGSRAYSRSTPGYSVTSLPNGVVQRTNQYGFTSFDTPSKPTGAMFSGGAFSGFGGGLGGFFGGGGQSSGKTSGGRTSGGKSSSSKSGGGRKTDRSEASGY